MNSYRNNRSVFGLAMAMFFAIVMLVGSLFAQEFIAPLSPVPGVSSPYNVYGYVDVSFSPHVVTIEYNGFFSDDNSKQFVISPNDNSFSIVFDVTGHSGHYDSLMQNLVSFTQNQYTQYHYSQFASGNVNVSLVDTDGHVQTQGSFTTVPEPTTYAMVFAGSLGMFAMYRRIKINS